MATSSLQDLRNMPAQLEALRGELGRLGDRLERVEKDVVEIRTNYATREQIKPLNWIMTTLIGTIIAGFVGMIYALAGRSQ